MSATDKDRPIEDLLARYAGPQAQQLYDEHVTELSHGLQGAALAEAGGAPPALVAAALLHDVGHLIVGDLFPIDQPLPKDFKHEEVGARYLARWFGPEVWGPVAQHVAAKRYLVATEPGYFATLTPSSVRSLEVQGGPMSATEQAAFRAQPGWEGALRVRRWDDLAKVPDAPTRRFADYHDLLRGLAVSRSA
jgi:predicted HD phosphohydrolase